MENSLLFFSFFSFLALICGLLVISSTNPVHSVFFLILVFCNTAALLFLLEMDFLALIFLVVYNVKYLKNINNLDNINNSNTDTNNINKTIFADWYETNDVNIKNK